MLEIVIAGGGLRYLPSAWITIRLLRMFGWGGSLRLVGLDEEHDKFTARALSRYGVEVD
jgi:hypothetical protein